MNNKQLFLDVIFSNNYKHICKYENKSINLDQMDEDIAFNAISSVIKSGEALHTLPKVCFYGVDDARCNVFNNFLQRFNQNQTTVLFKLSSDLDNLSNGLIDVCKDRSVGIELYIDSIDALSDERVKYLVSKKPTSKITYYLNKKNFKDFYSVYTTLSKLKVFKANFIIDETSDFNDEDWEIITAQYKSIIDDIINIFNKFEIPLIPTIIHSRLLSSLILNLNNQNGVDYFDYYTLTMLQCVNLYNKRRIINIDGEIYDCPLYLDTPSKAIETFDSNNGINFTHSILDNFTDKPYLMQHTSTCEDCSQCKLLGSCMGGCPVLNDRLTGDYRTTNEVYCKWNSIIMDGAQRLINELSDSKNDLFRETIYTASIAGCFEEV